MTQDNQFIIREAAPEDAATILRFIKLLAEYEHLSHQVTATEEDLVKTIFQEKKAEVIIGSYQGRDVGFSLFFHNYSTFLGKPGIYIEDVFVVPEMRGKGFGKKLLQKVAEITLLRECGRLEWSCLDWNTPARKFYESLGAELMDEWTVHRLEGDAIGKIL